MSPIWTHLPYKPGKVFGTITPPKASNPVYGTSSFGTGFKGVANAVGYEVGKGVTSVLNAPARSWGVRPRVLEPWSVEW